MDCLPTTGASSSVAVASSSLSIALFFPSVFEDPAVAPGPGFNLAMEFSLTAAAVYGISLSYKGQQDGHTWMKCMDSIHLICFRGGQLGKESWLFEEKAFVRRRAPFSLLFKDLDLGNSRTEGIAHNPICLLVFDRVVLQLKINEYQGTSKGDF